MVCVCMSFKNQKTKTNKQKQTRYPTSEFPPWAFKGTHVDGINWMNKTLGHIFMNIYESHTYSAGVKRCRKLAGLPVKRFSDGTPVYNLRFVPTATVISRVILSFCFCMYIDCICR